MPPAAQVAAETRAPSSPPLTTRLRPNRMILVWAAVMTCAVIVLGAKAAAPSALPGLGSAAASLATWSALVVAVTAFACEFIDSALGMGYGTTLTPVLLLLGYEPLQVVPAVLLSELLTGITSGLMHHGAGNVSFARRSRHLHVAALLVACSVVGAGPAVYLATHLPTWTVKCFIGLMVLAVGVVILATLNRSFSFSWKKIAALGLVAAFNKAASGGGYGPLVVGGQVVSGLDAKHAVGITSLAEGVTCLAGVVTYLVTAGIDARLALPLVVGAMTSVPLAVASVQVVSARRLRVAIGVLTIVLGVVTLAKLVL